MQEPNKIKIRRPGVRIPGISKMAVACGVSHTHMRLVRLGVRTPSPALKAKMAAYLEAERAAKIAAAKARHGGRGRPRKSA